MWEGAGKIRFGIYAYTVLGFLKKLFSRSSAQPTVEEYAMEPEFQTKPCRSCGRPISYNPEWKHIPNYCRECKKEYRNC